MISSTMAYLAYIGNWFSLTIALRWNAKQNNCRGRFIWNFKKYLYIYISIFITSYLSISIVNCNKAQPAIIVITFFTQKILVLVSAAIVGPLILLTLRRSSPYLYERSKLKVKLSFIIACVAASLDLAACIYSSYHGYYFKL